MADVTTNGRNGGLRLPSWVWPILLSAATTLAVLSAAWGTFGNRLEVVERQQNEQSRIAREVEGKVGEVHGTLKVLEERSRVQGLTLERMERRLWPSTPDRPL